MAEVVLQHLTKIYPNGVQAVRDLNLHVADGELVVLVGPSGCGKTTTLRMIAGLENPTTGNILIGDRIANVLPARDRDVAMVFQKPTLYPHLDVRHNLSMSLRMRSQFGPLTRLLLRCFNRARYSQAEREQRVMTDAVNSAAQMLELSDVLGRLPWQLSGGQQQRVALGRAIVRRPGVFLLDEPLSHLDYRLRVELRHELHLLQRRLRATMIYVTHDQAEAMTLADRVAVMDRGVVQQVDRPLVIYAQPANRFVADFIGWPPMNFANGRLLPKDGRLSFIGDTWSLPLPPAKAVCWQAHASRPVALGIRPEDIHFARPGQSEVTLPMEVLLVESLGPGRVVTLGHGNWQCVAFSPCSGTPDGLTRLVRSDEKRLEQKTMIEVYFNMEQAHLFDRSTGLALSNSRPAG